MRIAMIMPSFDRKGPFIVVKNIADELKLKGVEIIFISLRTIKEDSLVDEYKCFELGMNKFPYYGIRDKLNQILINEKVDSIHAHTFWPTFISSHIDNDKKVVTVHNNPYEDYVMEYGLILGTAMAKVFSRKLKSYDKVVCISKYVEDILQKKTKKKLSNSVVIYNGIKNLQNSIPFKAPNKDCISLITVAALIKRKNIDYTIELTKHLRDSGYNAELKIVGSGKEEARLKMLAVKEKVDSYVQFLGQKSYHETMNLIAKSDIFIFNSKSEGFGLVLVEAMMNKTVTIARKIDVVEEVVNNTDLLFENKEDFIEMIDKIITDYNKYQNWCYERYTHFFTALEMANNYYNEFEELLKEDLK